MSPNNRVLAFFCGLFAGAFLFLRFDWDNNAALTGWWWYQAAVFLAGIGLAGIFRGARSGVAIGLLVGPLWIETSQLYLHLSNDPTCCNLWPIGFVMIFFFCLPAPIVGTVVSRFVIGNRLPWTVHVLSMTTALVIGAVLPTLQNRERHRLEADKVPALLKQIHDAEILYRAHQPNGNFACDGRLLPGTAGQLSWSHPSGSATYNYFVVQHYTIRLDCLNDARPRGFRIWAFSHDANVHATSFLMDMTGKLFVGPVQ